MRIRGRTIILKFLIPYLLILVIPILIGLINYNRTLDVIKTETTKANMTLLQQSQDTINRRLDEVDRIAQQIMVDPNFILFQYIDEPFNGVNTYRTVELMKSMVDYSMFNNFISDYFVFFENSQLVMTPTLVYDLPKFYEKVLQLENLSFDDWYANIRSGFHSRTVEPASMYRIDGKQQRMITYIQSLGSPSHVYATIVILIDNQEFVKLLSGLDISDGGYAYIADQHGRIISYVTTGEIPTTDVQHQFVGRSGTIPPDNRTGSMMTTYTTSDYNGWTYVISQPEHIALEKVNYIKNMMLFIFIISLIAGVVIAWLMAYRSSKPIRFLANTLDSNDDDHGKHGKPKDIYQFIQAGVYRLKHNHDALQEEIDKQRPMLRTAFFERLLKGEFLISEDIKSVMRHLDIQMNGQTFTVAILSLSDHNLIQQSEVLQDLDRRRVLVKDTVARISRHVFCHELSGSKLALLFSCEAAHPDDCKLMVEHFVERMNHELHELSYKPSIGVGHICDSLEDISRSYQEAEQAIDYKIWRTLQGVVWFEQLPQNSGSYYYPSDVELKLMNFIKTGNQLEVQKLFAELQKENFTKRNLSSPMIKLFLVDLKGSIAKLSEQIVIENNHLLKQLQVLFNSDSQEDVQDTFKAIEKASLDLCDVVDGRKKSHNDHLIAGIIEMIHEEYSSPNFSLLMIAEKFQVSEVYLSYFIKEQTGVIFSEYLETLRMERAKELLISDSYTVKDIAEQVGYNSSNTFCRAFKRFNGVSTTDYKRSTQPN